MNFLTKLWITPTKKLKKIEKFIIVLIFPILIIYGVFYGLIYDKKTILNMALNDAMETKMFLDETTNKIKNKFRWKK